MAVGESDVLAFHEEARRRCAEQLEVFRAEEQELTGRLEELQARKRKIELAALKLGEATSALMAGLRGLESIHEPADSESLSISHAGPAGDTGNPPSRLKARIGGQHYLILELLREAYAHKSSVTPEVIAVLTKLPLKRVKDQLVVDLKKRLILMSGEGYYISSVGADVLERFKDYRRRNGLALPSAGSVPADAPETEDDLKLDDRPQADDAPDGDDAEMTELLK